MKHVKGTPTGLLARVLVLSAVAAAIWFGVSQAAPDGEKTDKPRVISVYLRRSEVVNAPWPVKRVAVTDPKIANVQVLSPMQVLVQGKSLGSTDLLMWSERQEVWRARIDVDVDITRIKEELARMFPDSSVNIRRAEEVVIVDGTLSRAEQTQQLHNFLKTSDLKFVDMTQLAGVQQVLLQVRVAEVSRTAIRALGLNALHTNSDYFLGSVVGSSGGGPLNPVSIGVPGGTGAGRNLPFEFSSDVTVSPAVTLFAGFPEIDLEVFIQALAENQYLRILAEPNLVALSGEEASFLAGGEFPIPVVQGSAAGGGSTVTIEYREFGVKLKFRPTVLGDSTIQLKVAPEVSELSDVGAVEIQGFRIPAVVTRRVETTLELKNQQTFAMAGLISRQSSARNSRVPGLGDVPVIGSLFRSIRYTNGETELVVLVTASLVEPMSADSPPPVPGDMHVRPNDWEFYAMGQLEGNRPVNLSATDAQWMRELGFDKLRGPGAWTRHDQAMAHSTASPSSGALPEPPGD